MIMIIMMIVMIVVVPARRNMSMSCHKIILLCNIIMFLSWIIIMCHYCSFIISSEQLKIVNNLEKGRTMQKASFKTSWLRRCVLLSAPPDAHDVNLTVKLNNPVL